MRRCWFVALGEAFAGCELKSWFNMHTWVLNSHPYPLPCLLRSPSVSLSRPSHFICWDDGRALNTLVLHQKLLKAYFLPSNWGINGILETSADWDIPETSALSRQFKRINQFLQYLFSTLWIKIEPTSPSALTSVFSMSTKTESKKNCQTSSLGFL